MKYAATLRDGGSLSQSWAGVSSRDQASSSPRADQISAVRRSRTKTIPAAAMVSTTVEGTASSRRDTRSVASVEADRTRSSSIQPTPVTVCAWSSNRRTCRPVAVSNTQTADVPVVQASRCPLGDSARLTPSGWELAFRFLVRASSQITSRFGPITISVIRPGSCRCQHRQPVAVGEEGHRARRPESRHPGFRLLGGGPSRQVRHSSVTGVVPECQLAAAGRPGEARRQRAGHRDVGHLRNSR